jgi:hypothetical protein
VNARRELRVEQGRFRLSSVRVIRETWDLLVIEADCESKYPGEVNVWSGDAFPAVDIFPGESSIHLDEKEAAVTRIILPGYVKDWAIITGSTAYTVRIACYRQGEGEEIWRG